MLKNFLPYVLLIAFVIKETQSDDSPTFVLKKTPQLPGSKIPTSFAVKSNDDILAVSQVHNSSTPNYATFTVYTGQRFEKTFHNYDYPETNVNDIAYSDSGFYSVERQVIQKSSYLFKREIINTLKSRSVLELDDKTMVISVYNSSTKCPTLQLIHAFSDEATQFQYQFDSDELNCSQVQPGRLQDLGNGMFAFQNIFIVYIVNKRNLSQVYQKINVTDEDPKTAIQYIVGISSFHDLNQSMITLQINHSFNYSIYLLNHQTQQYQNTNRFYNYGTQCHYYDINTCISASNGQILKIENIHHQRVKHSYGMSGNPFQNVSILATSNDSFKVAGYNFKQKKIIIYKISGNNQFDFFKNISYTNATNYNITKMWFTDSDNDLILEVNDYNSNNNTQSRVGKLNIQHEIYTWIQNNHSNPTDYHTGAAVINQIANNTKISRLITVRWKPQDQYCIIECRLTDDSLILANYTKWNLAGNKIINVKLLYHKSLWKQRFTVIAKTDKGTIARHFELVEDTQKAIGIKITQFQSTKLDFDRSVAFKNFIATIVLNQANNLCVLQFHKEDFQLIDNKITYQKGQNNNCENYRLISQQNYQQLMVLNIYRYYYSYIMDFYKVKVKDLPVSYSLSRRSIFIWSQYSPKYPFVMPNQQILVAYQLYYIYKPSTPLLLIYNISIIHIFRARNSQLYNAKYYYFQSQFAYTTPLSTSETFDEILAWTYGTQLCVLRNTTSRLSKIEQDKEPDNYYIYAEVTNIYQLKNQTINSSRTFLASTKQHFVSILCNNNNKSSSHIVVSGLSGNSSGKAIFTVTEEQSYITNVDFSKNGYLFMVKQNSYEFVPYTYYDHADRYKLGNHSVFQKVFSTNDDQLVYTLKSSDDSQIHLFYKDSDLKLDHIKIDADSPLDQIQSVKVSPSGKVFLVETKDKIKKINTFTNPQQIVTLQKNSLSSDYVDMFILESVQIHAEISQSEDDVQEGKLNSIYDKKSVKTMNQAKTLPNSIFSSVNNIFSTKVKKQLPKVQLMSQLPQLDVQYTTLIRFKDYALTYSGNLKDHDYINQIKGDTVFGASQKGGYIAYASTGQNNTSTIHVSIIQSYAKISSVANLTLPQIKRTDSDEMYNPKAIQIHFSSSNTLCVLTSQASQSPSDENDQLPPVLYMYFLSGCNASNSYLDGNECKCLQNFTPVEISSSSSKVVEMITCQCTNNFILDESGNCFCPTQHKFIFQDKQCQCSGTVEFDPDENAFVCSKHGLWWLWLIISIVVVGAYFIAGACMWKKYKKQNPNAKKCKYIFLWICYNCKKNNVRDKLLPSSRSGSTISQRSQENII